MTVILEMIYLRLQHYPRCYHPPYG